MALLGKNTFALPLKSINLGYKQAKVRLIFQLRDSLDPTIRNARAEVKTGWKWSAVQMLDRAISQLKHQEVMGAVQPARTGLSWGPEALLCFGAKEEQDLIISEVVRMKEESNKIKIVGQHQQERWEAVTKKPVTWVDVEDTTSSPSFMIRRFIAPCPAPRTSTSGTVQSTAPRTKVCSTSCPAVSKL